MRELGPAIVTTTRAGVRGLLLVALSEPLARPRPLTIVMRRSEGGGERQKGKESSSGRSGVCRWVAFFFLRLPFIGLGAEEGEGPTLRES
jgi:hypothetical protein